MLNNFAIFDLGMPELIIILAIVLLLFGGKKLPELSKSVGSTVRDLRDAFNGDDVHQQAKSNESKQEEG